MQDAAQAVWVRHVRGAEARAWCAWGTRVRGGEGSGAIMLGRV